MQTTSFTCLTDAFPIKQRNYDVARETGGRIVIDIAKLIALNDGQSRMHGLPNSLGDCFLYTHNRVFANVRDAVRARGFVFSRRHTSLWREYNVIPLLCLQTILDERVMPYCDNVTPLRGAASRSASMGLPPTVMRFLIGNLRRNYLLHESAHCIAHDVLQQIDARGPRIDKKTLVLDNLFAESFANSTETFAASLLSTTAEKFFFNINSFMSYIPAVKEANWRLGSKYGAHSLFKIICFSYFLANLRFQEVTPEMSEKCVSLSLDAAGLDHDDQQPLDVLFENSLKLNEKFREETASVYFAFLGCSDEFAAMYQYNLFGDSDRLSRYLDALNVLTDLVVREVTFQVYERDVISVLRSGDSHVSHYLQSA